MEFSELIADMSTKDIKNNLLTDDQKMLSESLWMANKSKKELYPDYQPKLINLESFLYKR